MRNNIGVYGDQARRAALCELGVPGRNGGTLYPHAPGSNGGVQRGRDLFPRKNVVRAMILHALGSEQKRPSIDPLTGQPALGPDGQPILVPVNAAMVGDVVARYQRIAEKGSDADFLRMMRDMHEIMADTKEEAARGGGPLPPATFVLARREGEAPAEDKKPEGQGLIDAQGHEYVPVEPP